MKEQPYPCAGCDGPVTSKDGTRFWVRTGLGDTVLTTHKGCEEKAMASHREQPVKRIPRPKTKDEKAQSA